MERWWGSFCDYWSWPQGLVSWGQIASHSFTCAKGKAIVSLWVEPYESVETSSYKLVTLYTNLLRPHDIRWDSTHSKSKVSLQVAEEDGCCWRGKLWSACTRHVSLLLRGISWEQRMIHDKQAICRVWICVFVQLDRSIDLHHILRIDSFAQHDDVIHWIKF